MELTLSLSLIAPPGLVGDSLTLSFVRSSNSQYFLLIF